jgi:predicted AAA+ superfamily ATPase
MQRTEVFHREELAKRLADDLMSEDGASGLFITGPRRTAKSTFIREDLIPVRRGAGQDQGGWSRNGYRQPRHWQG